ncbi:MAG: hypothetical protein PHX18_03555 [Candidatus Gastranaerophilales bacterium]|nr:hypothetical protein [Candidatus Gastranaerophilales bacterium]
MKPYYDFGDSYPKYTFALEKLKIKAALIRAARKSKAAIIALNEYVTDLKFGLL